MLKAITRSISKSLKSKKDFKKFKNTPKLKKKDQTNKRDTYKRAKNTFLQAATKYNFFMTNSEKTINISTHHYKGTELKIIGTNNLGLNSAYDLIHYLEETKSSNFILNLEFADFQLSFLIRK